MPKNWATGAQKLGTGDLGTGPPATPNYRKFCADKIYIFVFFFKILDFFMIILIDFDGRFLILSFAPKAFSTFFYNPYEPNPLNTFFQK
jgi:hypothetical protein